MKQLRCPDGNVFGLLDGRSLDSQQVPYPFLEHHVTRALHTHSSLVQRLALDKVMEGHQGCVNTLSWNAKGSLLLSGSDDTRVNIWDYPTRNLIHSIHTGHTANIFCTKFMPETGDDVVVSGAGDNEVRVHRLSRSSENSGSGASFSKRTALFRCHARRVKKLAVEEGNPHVVWSASEDGTLRQHDLRECDLCPSHESSNQECRNVLIDLRNGVKRSLSDGPRHPLALKTCAISPTRPHHLLVGGSDAFARLYDRRMLLPPSSDRQNAKPPPCVCYFCPAHLSDYTRSGLHLTHVTFSPNGQEVLLSYSGEHVYLMDANSVQQGAVVYMATDLPKRAVLAPLVNGTKGVTSQPTAGAIGLGRRRGASWLQECKGLSEDARRALEEGKNYIYAIEASSEVVDGGGPVVGPGLRHDCLCIRAAAFLKRQWKNDVHMAIRDCNEARAIDPNSVEAHHLMAEAFAQLQKPKEALEFALRAHQLDPRDIGLNDHVAQLRAKLHQAEETKHNRGTDSDSKSERRSRIRPLSDFFFRSPSDESNDSTQTEREESDNDEGDMEMEMEIEMSVTEDDESVQDGPRSGPSVNLRLRRRASRSRRNPSPASGTSTSGATDNSPSQAEIAVDMRQRYVGHCNTGTDIKQASFIGERGDFIASGSDDGRWFIWQKKTGRLVKVLTGDEHVVNCVQSHPFDCAIATSGIDSTIKLWTPCAEVASVVAGGAAGPETADLSRVMAENQRHMRQSGDIASFTNLYLELQRAVQSTCETWEIRKGISYLCIGANALFKEQPGVYRPLELLQRFRVQNGIEGAVHPFECTQS